MKKNWLANTLPIGPRGHWSKASDVTQIVWDKWRPNGGWPGHAQRGQVSMVQVVVHCNGMGCMLMRRRCGAESLALQNWNTLGWRWPATDQSAASPGWRSTQLKFRLLAAGAVDGSTRSQQGSHGARHKQQPMTQCKQHMGYMATWRLWPGTWAAAHKAIFGGLTLALELNKWPDYPRIMKPDLQGSSLAGATATIGPYASLHTWEN